MSKRIFIGILLLLLTFFGFAELRDYVVIVRAQIHAKNKETFLKVADHFDKADENKIGDIFRGFASDWHGSGFVVLDKKK